MADKDELSMSTDNTPEGDMYADTVEGGPISQVMIDDRALDQRAIEMLAALLVRQNGDGTAPAARERPSGRRSNGAPAATGRAARDATGRAIQASRNGRRVEDEP